MPLISASLLAADPLKIKDEIHQAVQAGVDRFHLDIMDGHFVPNLSFGPSFVQAVRQITTLPLDVHLMIKPVEPFCEIFLEAGADTLIIHPESEDHPYRTLQHIKESKCKAGLALNPGTPLEVVAPLAHLLDFILVMTVNPGFGGQTFLNSQLHRIQALKTHYSSLPIHVDGGVTVERMKDLVACKVDSVVVGTTLFKSSSYGATVQALKKPFTCSSFV